MLYNMHYGWGMGWGWIVGLIILVAVIWFAAKAFNSNRTTNLSRQKSALDILKERYAKGEISKEEYEEKKRDIIS
ncbi:MAG: SHOCT domain-containing protein [Bacteroidales bacterium]|nr:SHOCT domain-containing protein [Bacteroidales bacterium]